MLCHLKQIIITIFSLLIQLCLTISLGIHKTENYTANLFRANYSISFFVSLVLSLLDFLRPLLIIFKYLVYLVFFIKCMNKSLVSFGRRDLGETFTDVT